MTSPPSYLTFLVIFILGPIACLGWLAYRREHALWGRGPLSGVAIVVFLAVVYTTPWDNLLIAEGVWWYGDDVVAATVWHAPVGEYLFFILQPILTALWSFQLASHHEHSADRSLWIPRVHRAIGAICGLFIAAAGLFLLRTQSTFYLGAILFWAGPILTIQWSFGVTYLVALRRQLALAVTVPTLYLWIADRVAIGLGIWHISELHTTGYAVFGLPIEEALFFLVTNVFVVQALFLYLWLLERRDDIATLSQFFGRSSTLSGGDLDGS
ncbi:lycopene cyclase domain-containing protein [Natrarchaeobius oligotrophus]|uniref:Lycopene cyclase domain-containing protein n=1 Tax=Natrarchaeobius chitinivorans TaxID=1679083 RepID=A0A3N6MTY9_NATCH|nr:lycopene cyclase domain-containing protein [Natrarchaeobius chitinivorans]RQH01391.1 lycopene cyclase domain-containing protein [Natrarchaeobius chitinivorans]